jgi:hypothetical protein
MTLPAATYGPWANARLTFTVTGALVGTDPATGNPQAAMQELEHLATLKLSSPNWQKLEGVDMTTYSCRGRLLEPPVLDQRITNGSHATAVINGYSGRFELVMDLGMDREAYGTMRQSITGTFRILGRGQ